MRWYWSLIYWDADEWITMLLGKAHKTLHYSSERGSPFPAETNDQLEYALSDCDFTEDNPSRKCSIIYWSHFQGSHWKAHKGIHTMFKMQNLWLNALVTWILVTHIWTKMMQLWYFVKGSSCHGTTVNMDYLCPLQMPKTVPSSMDHLHWHSWKYIQSSFVPS